MSDPMKDKGARTGQAGDAAKSGGNRPADGAKQPQDWSSGKAGSSGSKPGSSNAAAGIKERMEVIASCGTMVGVVDHLEGGAIKLTKNDSPDGQHHFIPTEWVDHVDNRVHLKKDSVETERGWKSDAASCSACGG
jgi:hypothetical protein